MTATTPLAVPRIRVLSRELAACPDPCDLFGRLTDEGRHAGTFLLESADVARGTGERSILGVRAALRVVCHGRQVRLQCRSANGAALLSDLAAGLERCGTVHRGPDGLDVLTPEPSGAAEDESARLRRPSPLDVLRCVVLGPELEGSAGGLSHLAAGTFSYDLIELFESLPAGRPESHPTPHFEFWIPDRLLVIDHLRRRTTLTALAWGGGPENYHDAVRALDPMLAAAADPRAPLAEPREPSPALPVHTDLDDAGFARLVRRLQRHVFDGDVFQVVPSRTFSTGCRDAPFAVYRRLRRRNPSPCLFYVQGDEQTLLGASPEPAVRVQGTPRRVTLRPIAGTALRGLDERGGIDPDLDARREAALHLDPKELAEHMMLVDLARNDVARICRPGTREVTRLLAVDRFSRVMHLVSEVRGELAEGWDALHAYAASMNMGTLVGAPKLRAAELLRDTEPSRRGLYGGAVGYLSAGDELDTAIIIRAAVIRDGIARVRAGAGVVYDSDPPAEARETRAKAEAVLSAVAGC